MGIKGLNRLIRPCFEEIPKIQFRHHRVAIDFMIFGHTYWSSSAREVVMDTPFSTLLDQGPDVDQILQKMTERFRYFLHELLTYSIVPVVVFEESSYDLKNRYARVRRQETQDRIRERMKALPIRERPTQKQIEEWRSLYAYDMPFPRTHIMDRIQELLRYTSIPYVTCIKEAEHLCTSLCREGYVTAVYSTDTDVLPLRAPLMIVRAGTDTDPEAGVFQVVRYSRVLHHLDLTPSSFLDLCILCETDYNRRIAGIGEKKALQYIRTHGTLESIAEQVIQPLHHKRSQKFQLYPNERNQKELERTTVEQLEIEPCRVIFRSSHIQELCQTPLQVLWEPLQQSHLNFFQPFLPESLESMRNIIQTLLSIPVYDVPFSSTRFEYLILDQEE